jgi:hypothetical protein
MIAARSLVATGVVSVLVRDVVIRCVLLPAKARELAPRLPCG